MPGGNTTAVQSVVREPLRSATDNSIAAYALRFIFPDAFALLPGVMDTPEARAMMLAVGLQESRFKYRRQLNGPARGFFQFEQMGGVKGVLEHPATKPHITHVCAELRYPPLIEHCYIAIEHNDVLACCFARLLLWTLPGMLAGHGMVERGWNQYVSAWRPGKPHRLSWDDFFADAWAMVQT
jgi:hypothetical protein